MNSSPGVVQELLAQLYTCETSQECLGIAEDLAGNLKSAGVPSLEAFGVLQNLKSAIINKKSGLAREGGLLGLAGLAKGMGRMAEPHLLPLLPLVLEALADKGQPVREAAQLAAERIMDLPSEEATKMVLPILYEAMTKKWQTKIVALELLETLVDKAPNQISFHLPTIITHVEEAMHDTKTEV